MTIFQIILKEKESYGFLKGKRLQNDHIHTVDGSEIPFPTTWDVYKILQITGKTTNLNW